MRRGVICIGTGAYSSFVPVLEDNLAAMDAADVVFSLTDDTALLSAGVAQADGLERVRLPWGSLPWPMPTLFRYHAIRSYSWLLRQRVTHLVYCDVDMRVVGPVDGLFDDGLFAVQHPGNVGPWAWEPPFESDERSTAYYAPRPGSTYVAGGVQGGPVELYLAAVDELAAAVTTDHLAGLTARWHDESHWNRYVGGAASVRVLGSEYCWPEKWAVPEGVAPPRILALDKDHHGLRGTSRPRGEYWKDRLAKVPLARRTVHATRALLR